MEKQNGKKSVKVWIAIVLFAVAAILSAVTMGKIAINYNLSDYLDKDTQTKIALDIIDDEFGITGSMQVMVKNVSAETADEICEKIENVENVLNVNFDKYDETYYKDGNALFVVVIDGDDYSDNAKQVTADVKSLLSEYENTEYGGTTIEKQSLQDAITNEMVYILAISLCLVVAILLITSESWLEPIVLLIASGVAVLINRGTNLIFGEISYITNSISAILQLALSVDYSIVLFHSYRKEKEKTENKGEAMKSAIKAVVKPISASALTTIAGLLALLFMSFRIGFDMGIVLMKGIVISAVTSITLLPALVLLLDKCLKKTRKKALAPKGKAFCKTAFKASKIIVPVAFVLVIVCGVLQAGNTFIFTDTKTGNAAISEVFGNNNSVVVVYKNSENNFENEQKLAEMLSAYKTKGGKKVLTNYTAYTNTVRESYDVEKAVKKLDLTLSDAKLLFTMYNLYRSPSDVKMTLSDFINYSDQLIENDADAKEFVDDDTTETIRTIKAIYEITKSDLSAEELQLKLSAAMDDGENIDLFSIKQLYGLYFYDEVSEKSVNFKTMLDFIIAASADKNAGAMIDAETAEQLKALSNGIDSFEAQMKTPMNKTTFQGWFYQNYGVYLTDEQLFEIWAGYFAAEETPGETIPFLSLMKFLVTTGQITDSSAVATINGYDSLYMAINGSYGYEKFLPVLRQVAKALSGVEPQISATEEAVQQLYIMYFYNISAMPYGKINGKAFAEYALSVDKTNAVIHASLSDENRDKLADMITVNRYLSDNAAYDYENAYKTITDIQSEIKSRTGFALEKDKISGVYIKYAVSGDGGLLTPVLACDLLHFVSANMDTNTLLKQKITTENRKKVTDAQSDIEKAEDLFLGENYSRMLLSVDLPNESEDTTEFVSYLSDEVKKVFGEDAYITGEIVSTYDLEKSFDHDNLFITIFTLVSIFVIVMLTFRSLSLPTILVAVIQGAIYIAISTQLFGNGIFFMSYIVATCILMGATIDYGILMSSNYVADRSLYDRKQSLEMSVEAAMPTVFTSGLILTVCGFVIHFVSSQNSISTVGLLIGIGTVCSVIMITVVLPSVLYLLDKFVLKLSLKKKEK